MKNKALYVKKPDFNMIGSLYDDLSRMRDKYGMEQIILHLGELARVTISRDMASKVWNILNLHNRPNIKSFNDSE